MKKISFLLLASMVWFSCGTTTTRQGPGPMDTSVSQSTKSGVSRIPLVFVPGYKGSELVQDEGGSADTLWLTVPEGLGLSSADLTLRKEDGIHEGGVLSKLTLIPSIYEEKIYSPWLDFLAENSEIKVYVFPYDWRKDNLENSKKLEVFLEKVKEDNGKPPVVVGHSNGGLLSFSAMNRNPGLFQKAVFVGTPFRSGIGFMEDLIAGSPTGFNNEIAAACPVASFESVYTYFPRPNTFDMREILLDQDGNEIKTNLFEEKNWEEYNLGLFNSRVNCAYENPKEMIQTRLAKALTFRKSLDPKNPSRFPEILTVYGENRPTIRRLIGKKTAEGWIWDFEKAIRTGGDGRVLKESSQPPPGVATSKFTSEAAHSKLLSDPAVQEAILQFISKK